MGRMIQSFFMITITGALLSLFMFAMVIAISNAKPDFAKSPAPTGYIIKADITSSLNS